jgi:ceramide glucosyltransferase
MLYVLLALAVFGLITSTVFAGIVLWAVPGYLRERRAGPGTACARPGFTPPPLSLLKPLHGADPASKLPRELSSSRTIPTTKSCSAPATANDAGLKPRAASLRRYPAYPAQIPSRRAASPTTSTPKSLHGVDGSRRPLTTFFVISDSDVRVTPITCAPWRSPLPMPERGRHVTCPYRGVAAEGGLWARLEAVGMSVEMTAACWPRAPMEGMQFVLGPTMAFRRETIRRMGGFKVTADYCADDFILGNETWKLGQTGCPQPPRHRSHGHQLELLGSLKHQVRWMKSTRFSRPKGHFGTALTFSMPFGLLALGRRRCAGPPDLGPRAFRAGAWHALALSIAVGRMPWSRSSWFGLLVLYPIRDLMGFCFWAASYWVTAFSGAAASFELLPGGKMRAAVRLATLQTNAQTRPAPFVEHFECRHV